jgi:hypothetical protein
MIKQVVQIVISGVYRFNVFINDSLSTTVRSVKRRPGGLLGIVS